MQIKTDDFDLQLSRERGTRWLRVVGSPESLECFRDSVELAGHSKDAEEHTELLSIVEAGKVVGYRAYDTTVSIWLDSEVLNYL